MATFEHLYRSIVRDLDHGLLVLDREERIIAWNRWLEIVSGLTQEEVAGKKLSQIVPNIPVSVKEAIKEAMLLSQPRVLSQVVHGVIFPLCEDTYQSAYCYPIQGEGGEVLGVAISVYDLSQNRKFEELITAEVRKSEDKYRSLFEHAPDAVIVNVNDQVELANRESLRLFGAEKKEDIEGKSIFEIFHPDFHEVIKKRIRFIREEKKAVPPLEEKIVRLDGEVRDVEVIAAPFSYGDVTAIHVIIRDITEKKKIENALKESEEKFRTLAEATPTAVFIYQNDRIIYANPAAEEITGYSFAELKTINFWDFVHPDFKDVVKERGRARQRGEKVIARYEFKIVRKDGNERWVDLSGATIRLGGNWAGIVWVVDITERKMAEENFRRSLDESPLGVRIVSEEGETVYANHRVLEIFGYQSKEDFNRISTRDRYTPESYCAFLERREKRKKGQPTDGEYEISIRRTDGDIRHLQVFRKEILWNGKLQYQVLYSDITDKKKAEEALALSEERSRTFIKQSSEAICLFELEHNPIPVDLSIDEQVDLIYDRAVIRECNETFARSHGYERPEDMIGFK
ncbi:MAG: PAS domain S-box protein, partial [Syntrophales bacterium]|nr:PAS domain S-box protein [Syntrophales bacterium]